jgi:two-component system cell cycle response regulator
MENSKVLMIGVFGLSEYELCLVRSVLRLTSGRAHTYVLSDLASGCAPDIAILDPDNAQASAALQKLTDHSPSSRPALLLLTHSVPADQSKYYLLQPFAPTKLLALLDRIAGEIAKFTGTRKTLTATPAAQQSLPFKEPAAAAALDKRSYRALVIDDSPTVRKKLELELRPLNVIADGAESGEQALALLAQKSYDIIFLDIVLPGADGYEICKIIKRDQENKRIPVVMLTSKSSPFDRFRGSLAGCSNYLTKPVEYAKFHAVVEKCLSSHEAQQEMNVTQQLAGVT